MRRVIARIGASARRRLQVAGETAHLVLLAARSLGTLSRPALRVVARVAVRQVRFTGVQAALLTTAIGFLVGGVVVLQAVHPFPALGVESWVADLLVLAVLRELGPLITAVIVIGRSGTAMATEMATMRLRGEVEDLELQGIDPVVYLFLPRLAGSIAALFALIVSFDLAAVLGGYGYLLFHGTAPSLPSFLIAVSRAVEASDVALLPVKALLYGSLVASISCHRGLTIDRLPTEVPRAATRAVVTSLLGVFLFDSLLAAAVYA